MERVALCIGSPSNAKNAALYFDSIVHLLCDWDVAPRSFLPRELSAGRDKVGRLNLIAYNFALSCPEVEADIGNAFRVIPANVEGNKSPFDLMLPREDSDISALMERAYLNDFNGIVRSLNDFLAEARVKPNAIVTTENSIASLEDSSDITLTFSSLRIVDASKASWEQIESLKEDKVAAIALRRLRSFLFEELRGKEVGYISDRIAGMLDDYERASAKHGFSLVEGAISSVLDQREVIAIGGAVAAGTLLGVPEVGVGIGAALGIGKIAMSIAKGQHSLRMAREAHPAAYVIRARSVIGGDNRSP